MAEELRILKGIFLRDEIFEAIRYLMAKCAPEKKLTFRNESPEDGLVEDPELPQGKEEPGVIVTGQPGIGVCGFIRFDFP